MGDATGTKYLKIAAAVILPNIGGWAGSVITRANLKPWFASLIKPKFNPPSWLFAPAWTTIYCSIGYASYLVYDDLLATGNGFDRTAKVALALYANQMVLNWAWTPIFFGLHSLKWSAIEISALTASAVACGYAFGKINRLAGLLFIPYVGWLCFATYLNISLYIKNDLSASNTTAIKSD